MRRESQFCDSHTFAYNPLGALVRQYDLANPALADSVGYDAAGRAVRVWRRNGGVVERAYDKLGRVVADSASGAPRAFFAYDTVAGKWARDSNAWAVNRVEVDLPQRTARQWTRLNERGYLMTHTMNTQGQWAFTTLLDSVPGAPYFVSGYQTYSGAGLPDTLCVATRCLHITRPVTTLTRDTLTYRYGAQSWKLAQRYDSSRAVVLQNFLPDTLNGFDVTWSRDSLGRVASRTGLLGVTGARYFTYDLDGRLLDSCDGAPCSGPPKWSYDPAGNRAEAAVAVAFGAGNRLVTRGAHTYVYDAAGQRVCWYWSGTACSWGNGGRTYTYDGVGRLLLIQDLATQAPLVRYRYDAQGRLVGRWAAGASTAYYVHSGAQVVFDVDSASRSRTAEYAWVPGATDRLFALKRSGLGGGDWLAAITDPNIGTLRGLVTFANTPAIVKRYAEDPWGLIAPDTGVTVRMGYTGAAGDPVAGLVYLRARFYDPALGRFLTEDPIGIEGGANLYAYAANSPVTFSDPKGTSPDCVKVPVFTQKTRYASTEWVVEGIVEWEWRCEWHEGPSGQRDPPSQGKGGGGGAALGGAPNPSCSERAGKLLLALTIDASGAAVLKVVMYSQSWAKIYAAGAKIVRNRAQWQRAAGFARASESFAATAVLAGVGGATILTGEDALGVYELYALEPSTTQQLIEEAIAAVPLPGFESGVRAYQFAVNCV